jgi:outer membrane protein assembly factor BamB
LRTAAFYTYFPGFQLNPLDVNDLDTLPTGHTHHLHGSSVIWDSQAHGTMLFVWGENSALRAWTLNEDGTVKFLAASNETASAFATRPDAMPGGMLMLSANGNHDGIIWGIVPVKGNWRGSANDGDANKEIVEGVLGAYDASSFGIPLANGDTSLKLLWQSTTPGNPQGGDRRFTFDKFCPPVIVDGRVLVTTYDGRVLIYGL